jgi:ATP-binding cassette subfamily A (ABC1) protein 3
MVLTTHSMNEAESLCSVIGILIKGKFICMDTPKKLKDIYGKGFRINVTSSIENHEEVIQKVRK